MSRWNDDYKLKLYSRNDGSGYYGFTIDQFLSFLQANGRSLGAGGGAMSDLSDGPDDTTVDDAGKSIVVNDAGDGYELRLISAGAGLSMSDLADGPATPTVGDIGKSVVVNGAGDGYELQLVAGAGSGQVGIPAVYQPDNVDTDGRHLIEYYIDPSSGNDATGLPFSTGSKFQTVQGCLDDLVAKGVKVCDSRIVIYAPESTASISGQVDTGLDAHEIVVRGYMGNNEFYTLTSKAATVKPAVGSLAATTASAQSTYVGNHTLTSANPCEFGLVVNIGSNQITEVKPQMRAITDISLTSEMTVATYNEFAESNTTAYIVTYETSFGAAGQTTNIKAPNVGKFIVVGCKLIGTAYDVENTVFHGCRDVTSANSQTNYMRSTGRGSCGFYAHGVAAEGTGGDFKYTSLENFGKQCDIEKSYMKRHRISCHTGSVFVRDNVWADGTGLTAMSLGGGDFTKLFIYRNDWYRCSQHSMYAYRESMFEILGENTFWNSTVGFRLGGGCIQMSTSNLFKGHVSGATASFISAYVNNATYGGKGRGIGSGFGPIENITSPTRQLHISDAHNASGFTVASLQAAGCIHDYGIANSTGTMFR